MGKKSKSGKLERILAELRKLKNEIKSLGALQTELAARIEKPSPKKRAARPARKPAKKAPRSSAAPARKAGSAPKRPVLVSPDSATG
jgi:hypothetical protein